MLLQKPRFPLHVQGLHATVGKFPMASGDVKCSSTSMWCMAGVHQSEIQSNDVQTLCPMTIGNFGIHLHEALKVGKKTILNNIHMSMQKE